MRLLLTRGGVTHDVTRLFLTCLWSGDKSAISRQMTASLYCPQTRGLPVPQLGDGWTLEEGGDILFAGTVLRRSQKSDSDTVELTAYDRGYWLAQNDATYRFAGASPETVTRTVCADLGVPVAGLPAASASIRRKYAAVRASALLTNVWSLASEATGDSYSLRYTPSGLLVERRAVSPDAPALADEYNIIDAVTTENAASVVDRVVIYDKNGNRLRTREDSGAQALYGVMARHVTQADGKAAEANDKADALLRDNAMQQSVTVNVLGDVSLVSGRTVTVRNRTPGLTGVFWIDGDQHEWKNGQHFTKLTLNVKNVMASATAGSDLK